MNEDAGDPRVYFAAERTLLAWIRTGIGVMAFGLWWLGSAFSGSGRGIDPALPPRASAVHRRSPGLSRRRGDGGGTLEYRRYCRRLRPADLPAQRVPLLPVYLAWSLVVLGLVLTLVLLT
jgi:putative membrane protein